MRTNNSGVVIGMFHTTASRTVLGHRKLFWGKRPDSHIVAFRRRADNRHMPRTARALVCGYAYHVLNGGNARAGVFYDDEDYAAFAHLLAERATRPAVWQ